jgi:DNA invertase Pin-like site-specific DNA recombinase
MHRAALYLRASTEDQKYSTINQSDALRRYAGQNGMAVTAIYEDDGRSGLTLERRPELRRLLADVLTSDRPFDVLLVLDVSRWGRFQDVDESAYYEFLCRQAGVRVIYTAEPFLETGGPMAAVVKFIKRAMAAEYSRELSSKVSVGHRRLARDGFSQGGNPGLGLRRLLVDGDKRPKLILAPGERKMLPTDRVILARGPRRETDLVLRIFRLCADHRLGFVAIAKRLNRDKIRPPGGGIWLASQIRSVLGSERYIGTNVYGQTRGLLGSRRRPTPKETWIRCEGAFEPIVPRELFERAQEVLRTKGRLYSNEFLLGSLAALYQREGLLTKGMINAEPGMASSDVYQYRFRGLTNAYRLVGYVPKIDYARCRLGRKPKYDREELIQLLRQCLSRHGRLSKNLISSDPKMPSVALYRLTFGSLGKAYEEIGFKQYVGAHPKSQA